LKNEADSPLFNDPSFSHRNLCSAVDISFFRE
jgi:hypothetical protein